METTTETYLPKGGEFLIRETAPSDIFIREELNEEQRMIESMTRDFVQKEVWPVMDRLEKKEKGLNEALIEKAAELGLLGTAIPAEYGGFEKDFNTN